MTQSFLHSPYGLIAEVQANSAVTVKFFVAKLIEQRDQLFSADLDYLGDKVRDRYVGQFSSNNGHWNPLDVAQENLDNPFDFLRECLEIARKEEPTETGLFLYSLPIVHSVYKNAPSLAGLNCYMPDELVEGSPASQEFLKSLDDFLLATPNEESKKVEAK